MAAASEYLADTDALAVAVAWLSGHARVTAALGGPGRVDATNRPPYPRLRLSAAVGDDRGLRWLIAPAVTIEALGDIDGSLGPHELRRVLYIALGALTEVVEKVYVPGEPVVTAVRSTGAGGRSDLPTGQIRWLSTVALSIHPPG